MKTTAFVDGSEIQQRDAPTRQPRKRAEPPERLETRVRRCGVICEDGQQPCGTWTLHPRGCLRHRRQAQQRSDA